MVDAGRIGTALVYQVYRSLNDIGPVVNAYRFSCVICDSVVAPLPNKIQFIDYSPYEDTILETVLVFRKWTRSESGVRSWPDNAQVEAIAHE